MLCCEASPIVPNLASDLKAAAIEDVRQKKITANVYVLTRCANPYPVGDIVVMREQSTIRVFRCGVLVFYMANYDLKKYICGDWSDKLADEVLAHRTQQAYIRDKDRSQTFENAYAAKNYVVCD